MVAFNPTLGLLRNLRFRNPDDFQEGSLHAQLVVWEKLLSHVSHEHVELMDIIKEGVNVEQFLTHFKGDFKGKSFDSDRSPPIVLENSKSCAQFSNFISTTIFQWMLTGLLSVWGEIGQVLPPYLVLPLTIGPLKPYVCHDERCMSCPNITRRPAMRKAVTSTFISTRLPVTFSACRGKLFTLHFVCYRLARRLVLFIIAIWALLFPVLHVHSVFHFPGISTFNTSVSF